MTLRRSIGLRILRDALQKAEQYVEERHGENAPPAYEALRQLREWKAEVEVRIEEEPVPPGTKPDQSA